MRHSACFFIILVWMFFGSVLQAQTPDKTKVQWNQLRGDHAGIASDSAKPPVKINLDQQTVWQTEIPGTGWSSPVYQDGLIWLTTSVSKEASKEEIEKQLAGDPLAKIKTLAKSVQLRAIAVEKSTGKLIHNILLTTVSKPKPINPLNSYASPTPAISKGRVICHFGSYGTWCLNAKTGEKLWDTKFVIKHSVGPGSSPVVFDDRVILVCDGTDQQYVAAVDLETGKEIWKTNRPPIRATNGEYRKAYSTPILIDAGQKRQVVVPGAQWIAAYELENGKEIWRLDHGRGFSVTPMPIYDSGLVIFSTGYMKAEFVAVDPTGTGDVTETHLKWRSRGAPKMPSFVCESGRIYSVSDDGILTCLDAKTGQQVKRVRVGGNYSSSPLLAGGNLYISNRDGAMKVIQCSSELKTIATNQFGSQIMASPILIGDDLLVRTAEKLIRIKP